jgi:hypothetical protein
MILAELLDILESLLTGPLGLSRKILWFSFETHVKADWVDRGGERIHCPWTTCQWVDMDRL